jgi:hypothetical protein
MAARREAEGADPVGINMRGLIPIGGHVFHHPRQMPWALGDPAFGRCGFVAVGIARVVWRDGDHAGAREVAREPRVPTEPAAISMRDDDNRQALARDRGAMRQSLVEGGVRRLGHGRVGRIPDRGLDCRLGSRRRDLDELEARREGRGCNQRISESKAEGHEKSLLDMGKGRGAIRRLPRRSGCGRSTKKSTA